MKVTKQHNEECKGLLKLMGIPYVDVSFNLKKMSGLNLVVDENKNELNLFVLARNEYLTDSS